LHIRHFVHQQTISHMRKRFPEWVHCQVVWILGGSTLNSFLDGRKSNNDVFPSFLAIYVWYYEFFLTAIYLYGFLNQSLGLILGNNPTECRTYCYNP
jgi:hypothetical protein